MPRNPPPIPRRDMPPTYTKSPTITQISSFIQSIFPRRQGDTHFHYHTPRSTSFNSQATTVSRIVLSITPTPGFYVALTSTQANLVFLHRPWNLDRRRVPRGTTVLSSHKGFDEVLTVGNNTALASRLGMDLSHSTTIQGYKGDSERSIGIIGPVKAISRMDLREHIKAEFGSLEGTFGFDEDAACSKELKVDVIAIMNAFHPAEVERVAAQALELGLISSATDCRRVLYLTGAVRELGRGAALAKGMAVVCVGHRTCEEWGIRHLARALREDWPSIRVDEILEDENASADPSGE